MIVLRKLEKLVFHIPAPLFVVGLFAIMMLKTGVWYMPGLGLSQRIATNPFVNPLTDPDAHYFFWSWLPPFIAWLLNVHGEAAFFLLHFAFSVGFLAVVSYVAFRRLTDDAARISLLLFVTLPVSGTALYWVGVDSFTLFLMALAFAAPRILPVAFLVGIALGMTHFEQSFFGFGALLFVTLCGLKFGKLHEYGLGYAAAVFAGIIGGKLALVGIVHYNQIQVNSGRMYWLIAHYEGLFAQFFFSVQQTLWSILGLGWLAAVKYADGGRKTIPFYVAIFGLLLLLPIAGDQTRVLCIVTFPLVFACWLSNPAFLSGITRQQAAFVGLLWLLMPWFWVWGGVAQASLLSFDMAMLLHKFVGWFQIPADFSMWPFLSR